MTTETIYTVTLANGETKVYANRVPEKIVPMIVKATTRTRIVNAPDYH